MISWTRYVLGHVQETAEARTAVEEQPELSAEEPPAAMPVEAAPQRARIIAWGTGVLLLLMAAGAIVICMTQFQRAQRVEQQLVLAREQIVRLQIHNQKLIRQLASLQDERRDLDDRVFSLGVQLSTAAAELERANRRLETSQHLSRQLSEQQAQFRMQMASERAEREAARIEVERLEREKAGLGHTVVRLRQQLALLDRDYRKLADQMTAAQHARHPGVRIVEEVGPSPALASSVEGLASAAEPMTSEAKRQEAVELPPIIIRKTPSGMAVPLRGRLIEINEPHRFVIIDKGSRDGVREGMAFDIIRDSNSLGRATVVRVRPQLSACSVPPEVKPDGLHVGDLVVAQLTTP